jgi:hypothetical protein
MNEKNLGRTILGYTKLSNGVAVIMHSQLLQDSGHAFLDQPQHSSALLSNSSGLSAETMFSSQGFQLVPDLLDLGFIATQINGAQAIAEAKSQSVIAGVPVTTLVLLEITLLTQGR